MEKLVIALQIFLALGILNVWLLRFGRPSAWRGGEARNMEEEFAAYGLPSWFMGAIGGLKMLCAAGLLAGVWWPPLVRPSATLLSALMLGAVLMHVKVTDPPQRSLPALLMLIGCLTVVSL